MKYGFKTYKGKIYSFEEKRQETDKAFGNFAIMIPQRAYTQEEMKQFAINRLKEILADLGVKFYEL